MLNLYLNSSTLKRQTLYLYFCALSSKLIIDVPDYWLNKLIQRKGLSEISMALQIKKYIIGILKSYL